MRDTINAKEILRKRPKKCIIENKDTNALSIVFYSSFSILFNFEHKLGPVAFLATIMIKIINDNKNNLRDS